MNKLNKSFTTSFNRYFKMIRNISIAAITMLALVFANTTTLYAQSSNNPGYSESTEFRISILEQTYDAQLISVLSQHFNPSTFYVNTTIETNLVDEKEPIPGVQVILNYPDNLTLPGLPYLPEGSLDMDVEEKNSTTNILAQNVYKSLKLIRLNINVYADSSYTTEELDFLVDLTAKAVKANAKRGDEINIHPVSIPEIKTFSKNNGADLAVISTLKFYNNAFIILSAILLVVIIVFLFKYVRKEENY